MKTKSLVLGLWLLSLALGFAQTLPTILVQPQSYVVVAGSNLTVSVTVTGAPAPSLQWLFNGTNLPGANLATLTLNSMTVAQSGSYDVVVTNSFGSVTSAVARLVAVTINKQWTGGGDGQSWSDVNNWSGGMLPVSTDSIFIGGSNGTITVSGGLTVNNLICQHSLSVNGSLNVSGEVDVGGGFYISYGNSISVNGTNAMLIAEGSTTATAVNMYVGSGDFIELPGLTTISGGNVNSSFGIEAGPGAVLNLSSVRTMQGPTGGNTPYSVQAYAGAVVDLSGVTNIAGNTGVNFYANSTNGVINLLDLLTFNGPGILSQANGGLILLNTNFVYNNVSVQLAPTFVSAPQSVFTVGSGLTVTYSIAVSASSPVYYQWYSNSVPIPVGMGSTLVR
jgi:hypothetical protein